jgi:hypothetical protein
VRVASTGSRAQFLAAARLHDLSSLVSEPPRRFWHPNAIYLDAVVGMLNYMKYKINITDESS